MIGLFDGFEGYRVADETELRSALETALVAVDANVLLNLYLYNTRTTNDLLKIFERLGNRLVVPHQAMREFHRNRLKAIGNPEQATNDALAQLEKNRAGATRALDVWSKAVALDDNELQRLHIEVDDVFRRLREAVDTAAPDRVHPSTPATEDPVLSQLSELLNGKVLPRPEEQTWEALIAEGRQRVEDEVPPGYLDAEKDVHPEGAAGDFLVYIQACHEAEARGLDLIIVTSDVKEDWWWRRGAAMIGPRQEMTKEFFDRTSRRLHLMQPSDLLNRSQVLDVEVNPDSAKDASSTIADAEDVGIWTSTAVERMLARLRGEGRRDLADLIAEAASRGGIITRDEIYAVCGYNDDRMLRGITRPTARITAELQVEKILPASVTPMLTPLYRDAGPLFAIRIPAEVADILSAHAGDVEIEINDESGGKYQPLTAFLHALEADSVRMTFAEVEDVLGDTLAPSARKYLPYWYSVQNSLGKAIVAAGFKARGVHLDNETVWFARRS